MSKEIKKDTFVAYHKWFDVLEKLPPHEFKQAVLAIKQYSKAGEIADLPLHLELCLGFIIQDLDANQEKYEAECERKRLAGLKSAEMRGQSQQGTAEATDVNSSQQGTAEATDVNSSQQHPAQSTDKEKGNEKENEAGAVMSLSQRKFHEEFPNVPINCDFEHCHNVDLLIKALHKSTWARDNAHTNGLGWLLSKHRYPGIVKNGHADDVKASPPKGAPPGPKVNMFAQAGFKEE